MATAAVPRGMYAARGAACLAPARPCSLPTALFGRPVAAACPAAQPSRRRFEKPAAIATPTSAPPTVGSGRAARTATAEAPPRSLRRAAGRPNASADGAFRAGAQRARQRRARSVAQAEPSGHIRQFDHLVIGSGIAGLTYALKVAAYGSVAIITKEAASEGCTQYAQGGVCAVLDQSDSVATHVRDTMVAGAYLNDLAAVEVVCREGPARVLELAAMGAEFTRNADGSLHLTMEGGHSKRRIVHAADMSGAEIERALLAAARAHPAISFFEHHLATDLVLEEEADGEPTVVGVDVVDVRSASLCRFLGLSTMLASGGFGQLYPITTNPSVATGDGMAMAYRAGAEVSNMEFVQFHPTALYTPPGADDGGAAASGAGPRTFLITEAVRGEGGRLYNLHGERFMHQYDDRLELAPRDVVARAINDQMAKHGHTHVLLDISHVDAHTVLSHFPGVAARCRAAGIDITVDAIPVAPAQHYTCGGVKTGLHGETSVRGLWACGEVACSGLHGANRLASNSLLEGLVFGDRAVASSAEHAERLRRAGGVVLHAAAKAFKPSPARPLPPSLSAWAAARRAELADVMWSSVGIVRRRSAMRQATRYTAELQLEARAVLANAGVSAEALELLNLATVGGLVAQSALRRKESRGGHFVVEHPEPVEAECVPSVLAAGVPWPAAAEADAAAAAALIAAGADSGRRAGAAAAETAASPMLLLASSPQSAPKRKSVARERELAMRALPKAEDGGRRRE
uniref:L-aspartate oxidase n=1 Tax=Chlamydomonas euryale TaxID=1486919 RepID=A0A7R9VR30_9CHLO|mmetsp:Transcript_42158/g.126220  ORF Transcript_42158/g.126220 Transcript_42158/m.126220 type:complete len:746 (+) Transcript_42158:398-2635(+)